MRYRNAAGSLSESPTVQGRAGGVNDYLRVMTMQCIIYRFDIQLVVDDHLCEFRYYEPRPV